MNLVLEAPFPESPVHGLHAQHLDCRAPFHLGALLRPVVNKGVSKLQLLICGNEYIRVLKSRVERRDEEIGRLRKGMSKLRTLLKETEGRNDTDVAMIDVEYGYDLDLERDLDAVELQAHNEGGGGIGIGTAGIGASVGFLGSVGELEEEDND